MFDRTARAEEQDRALAELTELGLAFARELKAQVKLVKSIDESERLTLAFHRATRGARLAIALQAKLDRERHELARLDRSLASQQAKARKTQVRTVLRNEIYVPEAEQDAADALAERLDERLDEDALFDSFLEGPVEAAIARIREDLGIEPPQPRCAAPAAPPADARPQPAPAAAPPEPPPPPHRDPQPRPDDP
jgi:hypothetical protein